MGEQPEPTPWGIPQDQIAAALDVVKRYFGETWLTEPAGTSPVQRLWQSDGMRRILELHWLGESLRRLDASDAKWTAYQVGNIKSDDVNHRRGSMFEILGLALFCTPGQQFTPAKANTSGYDGEVAFPPSDSHVILSAKNFSETMKAAAVEARADSLIRKVLGSAGKAGLSWLGLVIESEEYPLEIDWALLESGIISRLQNINRMPIQRIGQWTVFPLPRPAEISTTIVSYQFTILAPYYKHELKSFEDKLEDACANASTYVAAQSNRSIAIFVRLPDTLYVPDLDFWTRDYFGRHPDGPVDEVIFYQPAIVIDEQTSLTHYVAIRTRPNLSRPSIQLSVPAGKLETNPTYIGYKRAAEASVAYPIRNMYIFQRGEHFRPLDLPVGEGSATVNFGTIGPNIVAHASLEASGQPPGILTSNDSGSTKIELFT